MAAPVMPQAPPAQAPLTQAPPAQVPVPQTPVQQTPVGQPPVVQQAAVAPVSPVAPAQPYTGQHAPVPYTAAPQPPQPQAPQPQASEIGTAGDAAGQVWADVCDQFSQQMLLLAEQLRPAMDRLEDEEEDPDRLQLLYEVDHAVTRMRRAARDLRVLAGRESEDYDGHTTSLVDVIRMAESSIEQYTKISIGKVVQLAVVAYAADDLACLLAALLDNAARYSPSVVTASAHLLDSGGVMLRIEDAGIGIAADRLAELNATLAGPVRPLGPDNGRHTGFAVVHRLARRHGVEVRLAGRSSASGDSGGTIAMVTVPPALLCEIPAETAGTDAADLGPEEARPSASLAHLTMAHRAETPLRPPSAPTASPLGDASNDAPDEDADDDAATTPGGLPRRERRSLRGSDAKKSPESGVDEAPPPEPASEAAAAARSFAADLEAFTSGVSGGARDTGPGAGPAGSGSSDDDREGRTTS